MIFEAQQFTNASVETVHKEGIKSTLNTSAAQASSSVTLIIIQGTIFFLSTEWGDCKCIDLNNTSISRSQIINYHKLGYLIIT